MAASLAIFEREHAGEIGRVGSQYFPDRGCSGWQVRELSKNKSHSVFLKYSIIGLRKQDME